MWKALWAKELKQTAWITVPAILIYLVFVFDAMRIPLLPEPVRAILFMNPNRDDGDIPFVSSRIEMGFGWITGLMAIALGLWQTVGEARQGTYPVLLHLPITRRRIIASKLTWGLACVLGLGGLVLLALALWAATPGTHPSPFTWEMTLRCWWLWLVLPIAYVGAFLAGLRPARWFGTRLFPLLTAAATVFVCTVPGSIIVRFVFWIAAVLASLLVIDHVAHARDFS
jgi:ABC-type transport system involved in multi-copper enzyme maturation permease subunit